MSCNTNTCDIDMMSVYTNIPGVEGPIGNDGDVGDTGSIGLAGTTGSVGADGKDGGFITYYDNTEYSLNSLSYEFLNNFNLDTTILDTLNNNSIIKINLRLKLNLDASDVGYYKILINDTEFIELSESNNVDTYHNISLYIRKIITYSSALTILYRNIKTMKNEQLLSASIGGDGTIIYYPNEGEYIIQLLTSALNIKILGYIDSATGIVSATEYIKLQNISVKIYRS